MKLIKLLGYEGLKVDIVPRTEEIKGTCPTELWSKKGDYMGLIIFDKKWKKWVLFDLGENMQMSLDCIEEAFQMAKSYWDEDKKIKQKRSAKHSNKNKEANKE